MLKVSEICRATNGVPARPYNDEELIGIITDSRASAPGMAFFALQGDKFDGHDFCFAAIKGGARVIVVRNLPVPLPDNVIVVKVEDTLRAYQDVAAFYRRKFTLPLVAVTGSTGKTTTKDIIAAALGGSSKVLKSQANFNNEIGLPTTLLQLKPAYEAAVVEMGMRGRGQIRELARIAKPTIGVVTNVGNTHIELLHSIENIAAAKQELVEELPADGVAVLNFDDAYAQTMAKAAKCRVVFFGFGPGADIQAIDVKQLLTSTVFTCHDKLSQSLYQAEIPLLGKHNVYNALCAIAVTTVLGTDRQEMLAGLKTPEISAMRQNIQKVGEMIFIDDTYNASPASMRAALELLGSLPADRKVAVLGDMLELGDMAREEHEKVGRLAAENGINFLITIGNYSCHIAEEAAKCGVANWHFKSTFLSVDTIQKLLKPGDTVLFKGSRGMRMDEILSIVKKYFAE